MMQFMLRVAGDGEQHWHLVKRACEIARTRGQKKKEENASGIECTL